MKISFIDDEPEVFPIQYGGKARTILSLAKHLTLYKEVKKVTILSRSINDNRNKFKWRGINFVKLNGYNIVKKIIDESNNADVINVHASSFTFPYLQNSKAVIINHLHDVIFATSDTGSHLDKAIGGRWDAVVAPSDFAADVLKNITLWSNLRERIITIPRAIDSDIFFEVPRKIAYSKIKEFDKTLKIQMKSWPVIFFPHRVGSGKGEELLPELCEMLSDKYPGLLVLATFDKNSKISRVPKLVNCQWIPTEMMKYFYSFSDLTLSLSLLPESFSQVCLESIICGTSVSCFRFGNLSYLSRNFPAVRNCEPNVRDVFSNITEILENPKITKEDVRVSKAIIKKEYSPKKITRAYFYTYRDLLQNKGKLTYKFVKKIKKQEKKYFTSPLIADYGSSVYLYENGELKKINLNKAESDIVGLCREARAIREIHEITKINPGRVEELTRRLINKKLIIEG